jgi:hypothetical protein
LVEAEPDKYPSFSQSEVHGQAMLNKAVTLDSMGRPEDAKPLYEKLGQHPKVYIQRKAGQMLFGFVVSKPLGFSFCGLFSSAWICNVVTG